MRAQLLSRVWLFVTPWTVAVQAPLSTGFSRQEYWSGFVISFSRGSSWPRDQTHISYASCSGRWVLYLWSYLGFPIWSCGHSYKDLVQTIGRQFSTLMTCLKWAPGQEPTPTKGSASSSFPPSSCLCVRVCGRAHSLESFISRSLAVPQHVHLLPHRGGKKGQHLLSIPFLLALVLPGPCGSWAPSQQQSHIVFSCS